MGFYNYLLILSLKGFLKGLKMNLRHMENILIIMTPLELFHIYSHVFIVTSQYCSNNWIAAYGYIVIFDCKQTSNVLNNEIQTT